MKPMAYKKQLNDFHDINFFCHREFHCVKSLHNSMLQTLMNTELFYKTTFNTSQAQKKKKKVMWL